jgi:DNA-binding transcriptional MerR regulator
MSQQTQIALDFGQDQQSPPPALENSGKAEEPARPYMAAGGVGVRIKAYKQTPTPQPGDLFGDPAATASPASAEPEATQPEVPEPEAQPAPSPEPGIEAPAAIAEETQATPETPMTIAKEPAKKSPVAKRPAAKPLKQGPSKRGRKSLKQVAAEADLIEIPTDEVLFLKQYYTMGEVSEMFRVNQSLLRFWETEFDILQPKKNKKGDRYFRPIDIKNLHLIYHLLRQKKYTIEGAKDFLKKNNKAEDRFQVIQRLEQIKAFLLEWKAQLG